MTFKKKYTFIIIVASLLLGLTSFYTAVFFRQFTLILLGNQPVSISSSEAIFRLNLLFAITFAFYPLLTALVNFVFQAKGKYSYLVPLSMFGTMLLFYGIRLYNVHEMFVEGSEKFGVSIITLLPFEQLQIESFLFVGSMIGGIVGAVFMKKLQKKGKI